MPVSKNQIPLDNLITLLRELREGNEDKIPNPEPVSDDELNDDRLNGGLDMIYTVYVIASSKYNRGQQQHFLAMILTMMNALGIDKQYDLIYKRFAFHLELEA